MFVYFKRKKEKTFPNNGNIASRECMISPSTTRAMCNKGNEYVTFSCLLGSFLVAAKKKLV